MTEQEWVVLEKWVAVNTTDNPNDLEDDETYPNDENMYETNDQTNEELAAVNSNQQNDHQLTSEEEDRLLQGSFFLKG